MDPRYVQFADTLVNYSIEVQPGEVVYIDVMENTPIEFVRAVMIAVQKAGGLPYPRRSNERLWRQMISCADKRLFKFAANVELTMLDADKGILIRDFGNILYGSDVPEDAMKLWSRYFRRPTLGVRTAVENWVLTRWPTPAMAQLFGMSTEALEDFFFACVGIDYARMARAARPLQRLMEQTDQVRIVGPGDTNLTFSIKGIGAVPCIGKINIPDGEVFTAPVRRSMDGVAQYNTKTISQDGHIFEGIRFDVKKGRIVGATCQIGSESALNRILDRDPGARYFGEWSLAFHPLITNTYGEILFDEKRRESFHLTPGDCYARTNNGNKSGVHWDIVCVQSEDMGGGEIYFDGKLIRKDGLFVPKSLQGLNPKSLMN
ncbi:MAG: hypothetical protein A2898_05660 [Candidatus Kerfeldbacteria bacterium RIFCSPLOWO2_01_FULL_48_11]|uniref:Aminopeptidase n=1 Tax=Candidatus Kerfeldbacteria bacterium RIFCSPLOWO2_01_FULL_48_11 TaxID=1798543 RepID=A0A1G2B3S4_9BACT|nr:MAG: Peptidase M29 aminopeptidase II [Parcubacteria group bacterium GW2011_GWA2_48_9]KKW15731.1 MAG: Peptidase M29 aminopeptidase II [Parcubacteria group bacterium GW2011_GWC2_49_9]OGY83645.1 MAG: hypothetical protein A2898_05660 [Candidatus Kerfeldbacteria bacterium RIFCSPLOWO2_01_FULL_48_11]